MSVHSPKMFQTLHRTHDAFIRIPLRKPLSQFSNFSSQPSFTVSYLINSCGLSPESALSASKLVQFETPEKPNSVLSLFRKSDFPQNLVSNLITKCPPILTSDPEKTLKPKIDFFNSHGISGANLAKILSSNPLPLRRSVKNQLVPAFDLFRSLRCSTAEIISALSRSTLLLHLNIDKVLLPNISILRKHGVPDSRIFKLVTTYPKALARKSDHFEVVVQMIKDMGFNPASSLFTLGVRTMPVLSKSTWDAKMEVYKSFGFSEDEILSAFKKQPMCMMVSQKNIKRSVDFFVNSLGFNLSVISSRPGLILLSLDKRIIPRSLVLQMLHSKGLISKKMGKYTVWTMADQKFIERFVTKYLDAVPELLNVYQGKPGLNHQGLGLDVSSRLVEIQAEPRVHWWF